MFCKFQLPSENSFVREFILPPSNGKFERKVREKGQLAVEGLLEEERVEAEDDDSFSLFLQFRDARPWWGCLGYDWLSDGVNPGSGHTPPRLNPPPGGGDFAARMAAEACGARGARLPRLGS
ncbi:hypothetical protein K0M31_017174 [Melipona bicolor]|uniref:Uncharacterized protein n=1 Tax=Melipona bicolor TaxID=60889 RepID=A0AA40G4E0_9HYME|nr:hypothetical protein K0M31_017174 [Melipona bicolor]